METVYFVKNDDTYKKIKELIKDQGEIACRKEIDKTIIITSTTESSFGFAIIAKRNISRTLNGFIVCTEDEIHNDTLTISLICSLKGLELGKLLLDKVIDYAKIKGYKAISLYALYNEKLIKWYENNGFTRGRKPNLSYDGKIKAIRMYMLI